MLRHLRLFGLFTRVSMQDDAAYRVDFLVHVLLSLLQLVAEIVAIWTIFSNTRSVAGWGPMEMLALLGVFRIMTGTIGMLIAPNMRTMIEEIRDGRLDFAILRPVNTQFLLSVRRVVLWRLADVAHGLAMILFATLWLGESITLMRLAMFVIMLAAGVTIIYSFWLVLATTAFWFTRITNIEMVFWNVFEAGRYPVQIYRPWVRWTLTYVIPLAFLTTFPAGTLLGKLEPLNVGIATIAAAASLAAASSFWRYGLRHYSGASA